MQKSIKLCLSSFFFFLSSLTWAAIWFASSVQLKVMPTEAGEFYVYMWNCQWATLLSKRPPKASVVKPLELSCLAEPSCFALTATLQIIPA